MNLSIRTICAALVCWLAVSASAFAQWTWTPETGRFVNLSNLPKETPELQVEYARSLMVGQEYDKAFKETNKFIEFYIDSEFADRNQKLRGDIRLAQGEYFKAAEEYQVVVANYPESDLYNEVIDSQYEIGDSLYDRGVARQKKREHTKFWRLDQKITRTFNPFRKKPFKQAIEVYTMVIDNQPFTEEASQAQYKLGLCHFTREEYEEAAFEYRRVLEDYSGSDWVQEAAFGLSQCYEKMSLNPAYDQAPSQLAINTINEYTRRYPNDPRLDEMQAISDKMFERVAEQHFLTARFHEKRGHIHAAKLAYEIVVKVYADSEAAAKAADRLAKLPSETSAYERFVGPAVLN